MYFLNLSDQNFSLVIVLSLFLSLGVLIKFVLIKKKRVDILSLVSNHSAHKAVFTGLANLKKCFGLV